MSRNSGNLGDDVSSGSRLARRRCAWIFTCAVLLAACSGGDTFESVPTSIVDSDDTPADTRLDPPCSDLEADGQLFRSDDSLLSSLSPLGDEPVVQVNLPRIVDGGRYPDRLRPRVRRVPGGMLVALNQFVESGSSFGALFAVDADGDVRWRRCLDPMPDVVVVAEERDVDEFLVGWMTVGSDGSVDHTFEVWSLADGKRTRSWNELLTANGFAGEDFRHAFPHRVESSTLLVLGSADERNIQPTDSLLVLDVAAWTMRTIPYPPHAIGTATDLIELIVTDDGSLAEIESGTGTPGGRVRAVESSGTWSSESDDLDASVGLRADFVMGESTAQLAGFDARGNVIWRRDDIFDVQAEGFRVGIDGDIALVSGCSGPSSGEVWCPGPSLSAVDVATGDSLWQLDGRWAVSVFGDGHAIVSGPYTDASIGSPPPWIMIDLMTGERASSTEWGNPWRFDVGCCDSPEEAWVVGGVVFTVDGDSIEMWYPEKVSQPLQQVGLSSL